MDTSTELRVVDPLQLQEWDRLVATHPRANFFHTQAWARTLANSYGFTCHYIVARNDERLFGLMPLMEMRSWLRGTRGASLPFTDDAEVLVSANVSAETIADAAIAQAGVRQWKSLEWCREPQHAKDASYFTHTLKLNDDTSDLFEKCDSAVRRAVRKAERAGVTVKFSNDAESLRTYYRLHCRTRRRLGSPPQPYRFFETIAHHVLQAGRGFIAIALHDNCPISGAVFFEFNGKAIYKFSASDERFQELRGANLVIWRAIEKLVAGGARELNFGRTSLNNDGLRRFKLGWGAEEKLQSRICLDLATRRTQLVRDLTSGAHVRVFSVLPVFVSRWIGSFAYPHLS